MFGDEWMMVDDDDPDIGQCDKCDKTHENSNGLDHCGECGNCWEHCECRIVEEHGAILDDPDEPKYTARDMFDRMELHQYHLIEIGRYGTKDLTYNLAIECLTCHEVIFEVDNPYFDDGPVDDSDPYTLTEEEIRTLALANKQMKHSSASMYDGVNPNGISVIGYPLGK